MFVVGYPVDRDRAEVGQTVRTPGLLDLLLATSVNRAPGDCARIGTTGIGRPSSARALPADVAAGCRFADAVRLLSRDHLVAGQLPEHRRDVAEEVPVALPGPFVREQDLAADIEPRSP